jgi:hypothetical protein
MRRHPWLRFSRCGDIDGDFSAEIIRSVVHLV